MKRLNRPVSSFTITLKKIVLGIGGGGEEQFDKTENNY